MWRSAFLWRSLTSRSSVSTLPTVRIYAITPSLITKFGCRDMPPAGGFEAIKYKRNLPFRGPGSLVILGGVTGICAYGFYRLGKGNLERRYEPLLPPVKEVIWQSPGRGTWPLSPRSPRNVVHRIRPHMDELICHLALGP
jgi:hypothetical protein